MNAAEDNQRNESTMLTRALDALDEIQQQLESERAAAHEAIAIIGVGCRFPGIDGMPALAGFLDAGGDAVREIPPGRAASFAACQDESLRRGGFFADLHTFDLQGLGVSSEELRTMDPQQQLLLQVSWQALRDAGLTEEALGGSNTGVYLGLGAQNFDFGWALLNDPQGPDRHAIAGSFHSLMPGRISYLLDLRGPSLVIDAACASGLVAVHLACQALRRRECDAALAAAVNLVLSPQVSLAVQRNGLWSQRGQCRSFDANADGFVRGEGCGVLLLKRLSDALAAGDRIHALIHGSAVGQDGRSNGLTAPNGPAQESVIRRALADAGVEASQIGYVEAHATGTRLGDAIEAEALGAVYGAGRPTPLPVGALKPNLGHLEAAAGMAGLVKAILAVERRAIPPTLHHTRLNPDIALARTPVEVVTRRTVWPAGTPYAGVSAFGMSGTNAHLIVGPAPAGAGREDAVAYENLYVNAYKNSHESAEKRSKTDETEMLAEIHWRAAPAKAIEATKAINLPADGRQKLLVVDDEQQFKTLQAAFAAAGYGTTRLVAPPAPNESDWQARLGEPADNGVFPTADIIYLMPAANEAHNPEKARARTLGGLLSLVRALLQTEGAGTQRRLFVVTTGAAQGAVDAALAQSLGRSLALEHPELHCRCIDLDPALSTPESALVAEIVQSDDERDEQWVRLSPAGRLVPRIRKLKLPRQTFKARPAACYLITGGFGGIGRMLAGWLIERGARDIMLLGRNVRELPEAAAWRARGVRLRLVAADVADPQAVGAALADLTADGVPLAAVFHAAGVQDDVLLSRQDWPRFAAMLRAKVDGAQVLRDATRHLPLDALLLFSSVSVVCGLIGASAYIAANAALGALARQWRAEGTPAQCIFWGTWQGSGMAENSGSNLGAHWQELGILPFPAHSGTAALETLLAAGNTEAIAARIDWEKLARWARSEGAEARIYEECLPSNPAAQTEAQPETISTCTNNAPLSAESLSDMVHEVVARILGLPANHPSLDQPFGELGLGSLAAIELRTQLATRLAIPIPATLAFNHPSVAAVVKFLDKRLRAAARQENERKG